MNAQSLANKYITWMKGNSCKCTYIVLALITLLGAGLRLHGITKYPTWRDEHLSLIEASGIIAHQSERFGGRVSTAEDIPYKCVLFSKTDTTTAAEIGQHVQLKKIPAAVLFWDRGNGLAFAIILHIWIELFGYSDLALRLLPCLLGIFAIPIIFTIIRRISESCIAALIASMLIACNALLVQFAQEVRSYSMAILLSLLATYIYIEFLKYEVKKQLKTKVLLYVICISFLSFTHYLAIPTLLLAHIVGGLITKNRLQSLKVFSLAVVVLIICQSVWMAWGGYLGIQAMSEHDKLWLQDAVNGKYWWLTTFSPYGVTRLLIERTVQYNIPLYQFWASNKVGYAIALIIFIVFIIIGAARYNYYLTSSLIACFSVIMIMSFGGLYSVYLSWRSGHTLPFVDRYYTFIIPYQCMLVGISVYGTTKLKSIKVSKTIFIFLIISVLFICSENTSRALFIKKKESFSFDNYISIQTDLNKKISKCDSIFSALTLSLKTYKLYPEALIKISYFETQSNRVEAIDP